MGVDLLRDGLVNVRQERRPETEEELAAFAASAVEAGAPAPEVAAPANVSGPCGVCGAREASARCANCERPACTEDLWVMYGLCRLCLPEEQLRHARAPEARPRPDLGVKWIED